MAFDDVFECFKALAAVRAFAAGACAVCVADFGAFTMTLQVFFDFFVIKRIAETHEHKQSFVSYWFASDS